MYIYTLIYNEKIIYVGSTIGSMYDRIKSHHRRLHTVNNLLNKFLIKNNITILDLQVESYQVDFPITLSPKGIRLCHELRRTEGMLQQILLNENVELMQQEIAGRTEAEYNKFYYKRDSIKKYRKENRKDYRQQEYIKEYERNSQRRTRLKKSILKIICQLDQISVK